MKQNTFLGKTVTIVTRRMLVAAACGLLLALPGTTTASPTSLDIYVLHKEPAPGLHPITLKAFSVTGYARDIPDLSITTLQNVASTVRTTRSKIIDADGTGETRQHEARALVIELSSNDSKALEILSGKNLGRRLVFFLDGDPIFAPIIRTTISTRTFEIRLPRDSDADSIKRRLEALLHKDSG